MKRKAFATVADKRIADLGDVKALEQATAGPGVDIPLPPDLQDMCFELAYFVADRTCSMYASKEADGEILTEEQEALYRASQYSLFQIALALSYQRGFKLALLRYADELKQAPEAAALLESARRNGAKGAAVVKKKAESKRQQARRLDRALRKTLKKKYLRVQRIATEMRCSDKTIERYLSQKK